MLLNISRDDAQMYYSDCYFMRNGEIFYCAEVIRENNKIIFYGARHGIDRDYTRYDPERMEIVFPQCGYVKLGNNTHFLEYSNSRQYKKAFNVRNLVTESFIGDCPQNMNFRDRVRIEPSRVKELFFPQYLKFPDACKALSGRRFSDHSTRNCEPLSSNFCIYKARKAMKNQVVNVQHLLYRKQVVGTVENGKVHLNNGCGFLTQRLVKEVEDVEFV